MVRTLMLGPVGLLLLATSASALPNCSADSVQTAAKQALNRSASSYGIVTRVDRFKHVRESLFSSKNDGQISRRYCRARADLSNGQTRSAYYLLEEDAAFAGFGWSVEACIPSADKWLVYGNHCSTVRPR